MASLIFRCVVRQIERGGLPKTRRAGWKALYGALGRFWRDDDWRFMNYGWLPPADAAPIPLAPEDEPDRPFIGLYDHAARGLPLEGAHVLEIGSGRGGGTRYVAKYFEPDKAIGVDFSPAAVTLARRISGGASNLAFAVGDAEALTFPDGAFDVALNIESSHCYGDMAAFAREAFRVLKPGGRLGWADMRAKGAVAETDLHFTNAGFVTERSEAISEGVVRALDAAQDRKRRRIERLPVLRRFLREFAGMQGSILYRGLKTGDVVYMSRRFVKPE